MTKLAALPQSLAILARRLYSNVTKSTLASIAVFKSSKLKIEPKAINKMAHSLNLILKKRPKIIVKIDRRP